MIIEGILVFLIGLAGFVFDLLPDADPLVLESFGGIWYGYGWLNSWLPLSEALICLGFFFSFYVVLYGSAAVVYVWRLLPLKFT